MADWMSMWVVPDGPLGIAGAKSLGQAAKARGLGGVCLPLAVPEGESRVQQAGFG